MLDCDLGRVVELLDDGDLPMQLQDARDRRVFVPLYDREPPRIGADGFVLAAGQLDAVEAVEVAALADELDPLRLTFALDVEAVGDGLDALVELPKQRLVSGHPLFARRHECAFSTSFGLRCPGRAKAVGRSAERAAANEARFRAANEEIHDKVVELGLTERRNPYLCECEDERCTTVVLLMSKEYEAVRSSPRRFLLAPRHQSPDDRVVAEHQEYTVVDKTGEEGRLVEESAPRRPEY